MSIDAALHFEKSIEAKKSQAGDFRTTLFLVPVGICLLSILLAVEFPAFASPITLMGME